MSIVVLPASAQESNVSSAITQSLQQGTVVRTLYVDGTNGNDAIADGSSSKPYKSISKALSYAKPGYVISIMGGVYRGRLTISKSGTATSRIIVGAFGNGDVILDASLKIGEWAPDATIQGLYKATCTAKPTAVVVNEQPIFPAFSVANIKENEWYYNSAQTTIYLFPKAGIVPTKDNVGVVSDDKYSDGIFFNNANYVTLYGITVRYAGGRGISILGNYNEIRRCNVKFNGHTGINIYPYGAVRSTDTIVAENNIYHNFLRNWPRGRYKWGGWGGGAVSNGCPKTQYIGNVSHKNGGEGLLAYLGNGGNVWRNNIVYDNWSVNIYTDNQPDGVIDGNVVFSSDPDTHDLYHNGDTNPGDNINLKRLRPDGIMTADEKYGLNPSAHLNNVRITNNIIVGCRRGTTHYASAPGSGLKNVYIANNIIVVPNAVSIGEAFIGFRVPYNSGNNLNTVFENNLIYASNASTYLLYLETDPKVVINPNSTTNPAITFKNLTFRGNIWYHANRAKSYHVGPDYHTYYDVDFNKWDTICGVNCINDVYSNITAKITPILDKITSIKATYK